MLKIPDKLKYDAIVEALLEIQFDHGEIPEVVVGQLAANPAWSGYQSQRLPIADLPPILREADSNLRFQAMIQLSRPSGGEIVKIGSRVLSLHAVAPYPGWSAFHNRLAEMVETLYCVCPSLSVHRVGLRYINALRPVHGVSHIWDMNFSFTVADSQPANEVSAGYRYDAGDNMRVQVALASPGYVQGALPSDAVGYIDVDVTTRTPIGAVSSADLWEWVNAAHLAEKEAFFRLWPDRLLNDLVEN